MKGGHLNWRMASTLENLAKFQSPSTSATGISIYFEIVDSIYRPGQVVQIEQVPPTVKVAENSPMIDDFAWPLL